MIKSPKYFQVFFKTVLGIQLFYLLVSFFVPGFPAWKMFSNLNRVNFTLEDEKGMPIQFEKMVPPLIYTLNKTTALSIASFVCNKKAISVILIINENSQQERHFFKQPECNEKN